MVLGSLVALQRRWTASVFRSICRVLNTPVDCQQIKPINTGNIIIIVFFVHALNKRNLEGDYLDDFMQVMLSNIYTFDAFLSKTRSTHANS